MIILCIFSAGSSRVIQPRRPARRDRTLSCHMVHGVGLQEEEVPVERHVEQVGHEGDLRDGQPELPGEEVVDDSTVAPAA